MSGKEGNISPDHFGWLVDGRSENQATTLELYRIIYDNENKLNRSAELQEAAQELSGIAFSLWRAVFLSDTSGDSKDQLADLRKFLVSLISDNTVLYITDKNSRNWSFHYYLNNARFRLEKLSKGNLALVDVDGPLTATDTDKDEWRKLQEILSIAIERFDKAAIKDK